MVHSVARHLRDQHEQAKEATRAAGYRLKLAGNPPHSVSLIYGWDEEMTLDHAIATLYAREINCGCETFWDGGMRVWLAI
jgi:hypothetical protein